jgi:hypothetical protein
LLDGRAPNCLPEELLVQFGIVRNVDILTFHCFDAQPISLGASVSRI